MDKPIKNIVIVGGGTAGWITAGLLSSKHSKIDENGIRVTLIESPDVATLGVGEGTWPTIRSTLKQIGLSEEDVLLACDASFKQGSRFNKWVTGETTDSYIHPFELPVSNSINALLHVWKRMSPEKSFAETVCVQSAPSMLALAPRQKSMPDYAATLNYAYHLDAVKLAGLLKDHVVGTLGVTHIIDHVVEIIGKKTDFIKGVKTRDNGVINGDLFIDCTGQNALILGQHFGVELWGKSDVLFNDRAVVTRVPVDKDSPIVSETISTAHSAGWIWDIGLQTRRGVGCVYSSKYMDDETARDTLLDYVEDESLPTRLLKFRSGYRKAFWHQNCLAIGQSAGFLEPLEASAIVMVELAAEWLSDNLPTNSAVMNITAKKYNELFRYRWDRIIDFLKLHYTMSKRPEPYWQDNRDPSSIPARLVEYLELWKYAPPSESDFQHAREVFPAASYQYVIYGMGMEANPHPSLKTTTTKAFQKQILSVSAKQRALAAALPTNRGLLASLRKNAKSPVS